MLRQIVNFILPPRCLSCREQISDKGTFCASCWIQLNFVPNDKCSCCGDPFEVAHNDDVELVCPPCLSNPPYFSKAVAPLIYDDISKDLILKFKHGDATYMAPSFAKLLELVGEEILTQSDYIMPVPLHLSRLVKRKYNQAALLCKNLSDPYQPKVIQDGIVRIKKTKSQGHFSKKERASNVANVFEVNNNYCADIKGRIVTIIDDVLTSGATVNACAKVLRQAGAKDVKVITIARVARI